MLNNLILISQQIIILFTIVAAGYVCGKKKLITDSGIKTCTNIVLYLATPCIIISSFIRELSFDSLGDLGISLGLSLLVHIVGIIVAKIIFPTKNRNDKTAVMHYATIFSNAGYMGLPLQAAILGEEGVFLCASYVAMFNILSWTYGYWCMGRNNEGFSAKKLINPGVVSVVIGLVIFLFSIPVPDGVKSVLTHFGNLNTPLPMLIIGYYLSKANLLSTFKDKNVYLVTVLKLVILPMLCLGIMYLIGVRGVMLVCLTISASAPVATKTSMLAVLFERDEELSVKLVSVTTMLSLFTMSVIVALSQTIA